MMTSNNNEDVDFIDFTIKPDNFVFDSPSTSENSSLTRDFPQRVVFPSPNFASAPPAIAVSKASILQKLVPSPSNSNTSLSAPIRSTSSLCASTAAASIYINHFQPNLLRSPLLSRPITPTTVTKSTTSSNTTSKPSTNVTDEADLLERPFLCHLCPKRFKRSCDLDRHMTSHSEARPFRCATCGEEYKNYKMLEQHQIMTHPVGSIFPCGQCGQAFTSDMKLKRHRILVHKKFNLVFKCGKCYAPFYDVNELKIHFELDHSVEESHELHSIVLPANDMVNSSNNSAPVLSSSQHQVTIPRPSINNNLDVNSTKFNVPVPIQQTTGDTLVDDSGDVMDVDIKPDPDNFVNNLQCSKCDLVFASSEEHARHVQLSCKFCHRTFKSISHLGQHILMHTNEKLFKCFKCGRSFKEKVWLDRHLKYGHIVKKVSYSCNICSKIFNDINVFKRHKAIHQSEVKDEGKAFEEADNLLLEPSLHPAQSGESNEENSTVVDPSEHSSIWHLHRTSPVTVDNIVMPPVRCDKCDMVFDDMIELAKHRSNHHNNELHLSCPHCEATFTRNNDLKRHLLRHTDVRPFKCPECDKAYKTSYHLRDHMLVHGDAKAFACELCPKTFKRRDQLRSHIYYRHSNNRVYSCPVCYKTSHSTYHFKMHMLTHSSVRPFRCDQCGKTFKAETQLDAHQIVHSTVKPFVCQVCGDGYKYKYQLHKHERTLHGIVRE